MGELSAILFDVVIPTNFSSQADASSLKKLLSAKALRQARSVVVVDQDRKGESSQIAASMGAVVLPSPRGIGPACATAQEHLLSLPKRPEVVVMIPGRGFSAEDIPKVLAPLAQKNNEISFGMSLATGHNIPKKLAHSLLPLPSRGPSPFCAIRFAALIALGLSAKDTHWFLAMAVKAEKYGMTTAEVPVSGCIKKEQSVRGLRGIRRIGSQLWTVFRHATLK